MEFFLDISKNGDFKPLFKLIECIVNISFIWYVQHILYIGKNKIFLKKIHKSSFVNLNLICPEMNPQDGSPYSKARMSVASEVNKSN